jgi:hypothetical protein
MEHHLEQRGVIPKIHGWSQRLRCWYYGHGRSVSKDDSLCFIDNSKDDIENIIDSMDKMLKGEFVK